MTIKLRPETRKALEPEIAKFLELTTVTNGNVVNVLSSFSVLWEAESLLPKEGPVRKQLNEYVGEHSLAIFIADELREQVLTGKYEEGKESEPLLKALGIDDPRPLAQELLNALESLPRSYWATLPLPANLSDFVTRLPPVRSFGSSIRLIHESEMMKAVAPANTLGSLMANALLSATWVNPSDAKAALQVQVDGFVPRFGGGETADEAHGRFKSFFGMALAVGLLKTADFPQAQPTRLGMIFHLGDPTASQPVSRIPLTDAETTTISGLSYAGRLSGDRQDMTEAEGRMGDMEIIFSAPEQHQLLLRACRWLFDSHVSEDPLLSFVQATVVLEILLGEKAPSDEVGLSTLLANRCAYMIGASTSERTAIIKHFKALYGTRSQIVHSGKHRLSGSEKVQLHQLRALGRRVICAEMRLAIEEIRRQERRAATPKAQGAAPVAKRAAAPVEKRTDTGRHRRDTFRPG